MKILIKKFSWWLVMPFFMILFLVGCKSREKAVQKTETQTEKKTEATYHIEDKTFETVSDKELTYGIKTIFAQENEAKKDEIKNVEVIREYYENGTLKKEMQKSFSQLSEATKTAIAEMREELSKETESSKYWENSSNHFQNVLEQEKIKTKHYEMKLKSKPTFTWQWFLSGLLVGWIALPPIFRWLWGWIKRFQPWIKFLEWVKNLKK